MRSKTRLERRSIAIIAISFSTDGFASGVGLRTQSMRWSSVAATDCHWPPLHWSLVWWHRCHSLRLQNSAHTYHSVDYYQINSKTFCSKTTAIFSFVWYFGRESLGMGFWFSTVVIENTSKQLFYFYLFDLILDFETTFENCFKPKRFVEEVERCQSGGEAAIHEECGQSLLIYRFPANE